MNKATLPFSLQPKRPEASGIEKKFKKSKENITSKPNIWIKHLLFEQRDDLKSPDCPASVSANKVSSCEHMRAGKQPTRRRH